MDLGLNRHAELQVIIFFSIIHLCNNEKEGWQKMIRPVESVIYTVIFKCPLQKCDLPDHLKQVFKVSIYVSPKPEMSLKKNCFQVRI